MECPICLENISNIHALICGHSYCGPPKSCLNTLKHNKGKATKCAVCNTVLKIKVSDLKPLYGIREVLSEIGGIAKHYRETAEKLMPLLDDIDSVLSETVREIEMLEDKKLKFDQLKEYKTSIVQFVNGQKTLSNELKELFDTEWIQTIGTDRNRNSLKNIKLTFCIAHVKDVENKVLCSEKIYLQGFLFHIAIGKVLTAGEEWIKSTFFYDLANTRNRDAEVEIKFQMVLLSSNPAKSINYQFLLHKGTNVALCKPDMVRWKNLQNPRNGFISKNESLVFQICVETLRIIGDTARQADAVLEFSQAELNCKRTDSNKV